MWTTQGISEQLNEYKYALHGTPPCGQLQGYLTPRTGFNDYKYAWHGNPPCGQLQGYLTPRTGFYEYKYAWHGNTPCGQLQGYLTPRTGFYEYKYAWHVIPPCGQLQGYITPVPGVNEYKFAWHGNPPGISNTWRLTSTAMHKMVLHHACGLYQVQYICRLEQRVKDYHESFVACICIGSCQVVSSWIILSI
jgi:hypothetical protein